jgi:hypothetical protein
MSRTAKKFEMHIVKYLYMIVFLVLLITLNSPLVPARVLSQGNEDSYCSEEQKLYSAQQHDIDTDEKITSLKAFNSFYKADDNFDPENTSIQKLRTEEYRSSESSLNSSKSNESILSKKNIGNAKSQLCGRCPTILM